VILNLLSDPGRENYKEIEKDRTTYQVDITAYYENKWTRENVKVRVTSKIKRDGMLQQRYACICRSGPTKTLWPDRIPTR